MVEGQGWTVDTLREYLQSQIDERDRMYSQRYDMAHELVDRSLTAQDKAVAAALTAAKEAVDKAEMAAEKRFEAVNEFRAQLADQASTFMPREVADATFTEIRKQVSENSRRLNEMQGHNVGVATDRAETRLNTGQTIAVISLIIGFIVVLVNVAVVLIVHG